VSKREEFLEACAVADWEQVRQNGGPPCFYIEDGRFCLRAERWAGHYRPGQDHTFTTLHEAASRIEKNETEITH